MPCVCIGLSVVYHYYNLSQLPATARANFGLTADSYVMGYLTNSSLLKQGFTQLLSGAGWIVRRYIQYGGCTISCSLETVG